MNSPTITHITFMNSSIKSSILAIFCCVSSLAAAADALSSRNTNPALLYWQAAAELPPLSDAQAKQLREVAGGKVDFKAELIEELNFEWTVKFLRKAVASEAPCEWGLALEEGIEAPTPHLAKMREFSTMALVLAEAKFAKGETTAGIDLLLMAHHIARDADAAPSLISNVIQNVLERRTIATAARHCMSWDAAGREDYARRLTLLPDLNPLPNAFATELVWIGAWEKELEENFDQARKKFGLVASSEKSDPFRSPELIKEMLETYHKMHERGMVILALEGEARRLAVAEFEKDMEADLTAKKRLPKNILVALAMPALSNMVRGEDQSAIAQAMLKSALVHGPEISEKDLEGQPFKLVRKEGGWELSSNELEFVLEFGR